MSDHSLLLANLVLHPLAELASNASVHNQAFLACNIYYRK